MDLATWSLRSYIKEPAWFAHETGFLGRSTGISKTRLLPCSQPRRQFSKLYVPLAIATASEPCASAFPPERLSLPKPSNSIFGGLDFVFTASTDPPSVAALCSTAKVASMHRRDL